MLGIFDSGVGGLTVLKELERLLPQNDIIFFGDTARAPYGTKGPKTVQHFAIEAVELLRREGATSFVVACHTMSAIAIEAIRETEKSAPVYDVISSTVEALKKLSPRHLGVIGTRATINSGIYSKLLKPSPILSRACPLLVPLIEEGWSDRPETKSILRSYLQPFQGDVVDTLVLGCTHYPHLRIAIEAILGPKVNLVDPSHEVASRVKENSLIGGSGKRRYLFSDITPATEEIAEKWLGHEVNLELVSAERS